MSELNWSAAIQHCQQQGEAYVIATVMGCQGSTPRDPGSKMVITASRTYDTIGGGQLEFDVTRRAREMLLSETSQAGRNQQQIQHFPLAASVAQCCGGSATILLEAMAASPFRVVVFGAGHVAAALMNILGGLPCRVRWVDQRDSQFPVSLPANVVTDNRDDPVSVMTELMPGTDVLILTHDHQLDYRLCQAALAHPGLRFIGMIGSRTKASRFRARLQREFSDEQINRLTTPIGLPEVPGKLPMEIAVSIAGQLIAIEHADRKPMQKRGLLWKDVKSSLQTDAAHRLHGYTLTLDQASLPKEKVTTITDSEQSDPSED